VTAASAAFFGAVIRALPPYSADTLRYTFLKAVKKAPQVAQNRPKSPQAAALVKNSPRDVCGLLGLLASIGAPAD
jgi:hypothetical protein